jgi:hypothetical protein
MKVRLGSRKAVSCAVRTSKQTTKSSGHKASKSTAPASNWPRYWRYDGVIIDLDARISAVEVRDA